MKVVTFDIETSPHLVYSWDVWKQDIGPSQLVEPSRLLMWCARVLGEKEFICGGRSQKDLARLHKLMCEADILVSYNGKKFDSKVLNREYLQAGLGPLPKTVHVDLYQVVKSNFKFPHNKLDSITKSLSIGAKMSTGGFGLWIGVMGGDKAAIKTMREYNKQDVVLTERLYHILKPWASVLPYSDTCRACGSSAVERRGWNYGKGWRAAKLMCAAPGCGRWRVGTKERVD